MARRSGGSTQVVYMDDFSGGVNYIESPYTLPQPFLPPGAFNVTIRGRQLVSRFGTRLAGTLTATGQYIFYSSRLNLFFSQEGTGFYKYTISATNQALSARTNVTTFTTSAKCMAVEFAGVLVVVHPVDGVFTYDGTTWTNRSTTVKGTCIATWQNKAWVAGDSSNPSRVWWSNAGTPNTWTTSTDFVDVREVDDRAVTAIGGGNGMDVVGRPSLNVFKTNSVYRIYSSSTGAYTTLDGWRGATGSESVTSAQGTIYFCNYYGIYRIDNDRVVTLSDPIRPAWDVGTQYANQYTAWTSWDRVYFSNLGSQSTEDASYANRRLYWELVPERAAWFPHGFTQSGGTAAFNAPISATRFIKGTTASVNSAMLLSDDGTSVLVAPHHPSGFSSSMETPPVAKDSWNGTTGNNVRFTFSLPTITQQMRRFSIRHMQVQGWGDGATNNMRLRWGNWQEQPNSPPAAFTDFTLALPDAMARATPPYVPVPLGVYTSLRPFLTGAQSAIVNADPAHLNGAGDQWSPISKNFQLPGYAIEAVQYKVAMQE